MPAEGDARVTSPRTTWSHTGFGGTPTRRRPGSPLTGDQRPPLPLPPEPTHTPTRHSTPQSHTQHAKPFLPGPPGRCEIPRREAASATCGFPKAATSPELPSLLREFERPRGEQDQGERATGLSWKKQLASSFKPPPPCPPARRGLDVCPWGLAPTQEIRGEKGQ